MGGLIVQDAKGTAGQGDDGLKLVFGGASHDLVLVDAGQWLYRTKDETVWKLQYDSAADAWTLWTKDGTAHRFGGTPDSQAGAWLPDLSAPFTYKYLLNEVTTPTGLGVRYAYSRYQVTSTQTGLPYTQAVYPQEITYTYAHGTPVGPLRTLTFLRAARTDADLLGTADFHFFERERLYAIEGKVGSTLMRRYVLEHDYSIDRDPTSTWSGGAAGDLTLLRLTLYGADGTSPLPPISFTYADGVADTTHLATVANGLGGTVAFTYDRVATLPIYAGYLFWSDDPAECYDRGARTSPGPSPCAAFEAVFGHALTASREGSVPLYATCKRTDPDQSFCQDHGVAADPGASPPFAALLGHLLGTNPPGTLAVYANYDRYVIEDYGQMRCVDAAVATTGSPPGGCTPGEGYSPPAFLGDLYGSQLDRARVLTRTVHDGRTPPAVTAYAYGVPALSSTGEFRGHDWVRVTDPAAHTAKTWFHQDDARKGRIAQVETRSASGALYTTVVNTWTPTSPAPGVTFAALSRTDTATCDGTAACKQAAQLLTYDPYGNVSSAQSLGDLALSGDERTEVTEYAYNPTAYLVGLPQTTRTLDHTGATVAQTWFAYDGAPDPATPPTQGRLTKQCPWLHGGENPCVTLTHDAYGNVATVTDARGSVTTTTYDATFHTFPVSVTTPGTPNAPGGLATHSTYDERFGVVLTVTDPNNAATTHAYDAFGRRLSTPNALNQPQTVAYDGFGTVGTQRVTTTLAAGTAAALWAERYFDGLGRIFQVRKQAPAGQVVVLKTAYDARGLVAQQSLPRFAGAPPRWTTFTSDPLGRPLATTFPDGTSAAAAYAEWTVTVTDRAGRTRTRVKDAYGRTVQVGEPLPGSPTTSDAYDALGRLTAVTDAGG